MIASHINEAIAAIFGLRAKSLEQGIKNLLSDPQLVDKVWNHSLVQSLFAKTGKAPSYTPSNTFVLAVFDALVPPSGQPTALGELYATAQQLPASPAKQSILSIIQHADGDVNKARAGVENWFNSAMDRLTGEYKRAIQPGLGQAAARCGGMAAKDHWAGHYDAGCFARRTLLVRRAQEPG